MHFSSLLVAALVSVTTLASSLGDFQISIVNNCPFAIYTRTDYKGGRRCPTTYIKPGETFDQSIWRSGAAVLMGIGKHLMAPLTLRYTPIDNIMYYDLSNHVGPPFIDYGAMEIPNPYPSCSIAGCGPQARDCYSNSTNSKIPTCQLTGYKLELCGLNPALRTFPTFMTAPVPITTTSASFMTMPVPVTTTSASFITMPIPVTTTSASFIVQTMPIRHITTTSASLTISTPASTPLSLST